MSDGDEIELARRRQAADIVRMAVMASGEPDEHWQQRVLDLVPRIAALMISSPNYPGAIEAASWVLQSSVFRAHFDHAEKEESSQRVLVYVKAQNSEDAEPLRTEPLYTALGKSMAWRVRQLVEGDEILVYKYIDQIDGKRKVRMLANFEVLRAVRRPESSADAPAAPNGRDAVADEGTGVAPPSAPVPESTPNPGGDAADGSVIPTGTSAASSIDDTLGPDPGRGRRPSGESEEDAAARRMAAVEEGIKGFDNRKKVAVNAITKGMGIKAWACPADDEELDKVLVIINKVARGELP